MCLFWWECVGCDLVWIYLWNGDVLNYWLNVYHNHKLLYLYVIFPPRKLQSLSPVSSPATSHPSPKASPTSSTQVMNCYPNHPPNPAPQVLYDNELSPQPSPKASPTFRRQVINPHPTYNTQVWLWPQALQKQNTYIKELYSLLTSLLLLLYKQCHLVNWCIDFNIWCKPLCYLHRKDLVNYQNKISPRRNRGYLTTAKKIDQHWRKLRKIENPQWMVAATKRRT